MEKKLLTKTKIILLFFLSLFTLFIVHYSLFVTPARAQIPQLKLPCTEERDNEFHSLRPYQAAPCGDANKAYYCSNDLIFTESFDVTNRPGTDCKARGYEGTFTCHPNLPVLPHDLYIELDNSQFPIMGNTEQVKNSQNSGDEFDDATKLNEYASWYLSGVNGRAEYGESTIDQLVNFSGPVQKLLPQAIAEDQRIRTIESATKEVPVTDEDTGKTSSEPQTHNQIVVCASHQILRLIGKMVPHECYTGNGSPAKQKIYRLKDWDNHLPPLPWDPKFGGDSEKYLKARCEWKGGSYITIPFTDKSLCVDNPFESNEWSDLFSYVPLGNTTDKKGAEMITGVEIKPAPGTEIDPGSKGYGDIRNAPLYFAHTEEVRQLSEILNKTYQPAEYKSEPLPETTEFNDCSVVNIRANQGDNLFPGDPDEIRVPDVTYKITEAECKETFREELCVKNRARPEYDGVTMCPVHSVKCNAQVSVTIKTQTKTPSAQEIFSQTVADSGSTFRKIFPQVSQGAPVSCIASMPTVTGVEYDPTGSQKPGGGSQEFKVKKNPEDGAGSTPELTFPFIGSIYEYFLKGIQTALRPQGYGEPITDGQYCQTTSDTSLGDVCAVADAYHIPCCQLKGIAELETGSGKNVGSGSCSTKNGNFRCCNGGVCGPSQVACGQYNAFAGKDKIDMCDPAGSAELLARAMLLKLCQAAGKCDSYDWTTMKSKAMQFKVQDGNYTAAAYFYGLANGCTVSACTQYRWGPGKTYCDSVKSYCQSGKILPDNPYPAFCATCNQELERAGQQPINCANP